jgi:hypothetical protein
MHGSVLSTCAPKDKFISSFAGKISSLGKTSRTHPEARRLAPPLRFSHKRSQYHLDGNVRCMQAQSTFGLDALLFGRLLMIQ